MSPGRHPAFRPDRRGCGCAVGRGRLLLGLLAGLALSLPSGVEAQTAGAYGQLPPQAPAAYHIAITPSGLPYVVPSGQGAGPVIWPYQNQPYAPPAYGGQGLPQAGQPQDPLAPQQLPILRATAPAPPPRVTAPAPPPAPPPTPAPQAVSPAPLPAVQPVEPEPTPVVYKEGVYAIDEDYLLSWPENTYRFFTSPLRFDETDWLVAAGVAGVAGALFLADKALADFWQDNIKSSITDDGSDFFREFGEFDHLFIGTVGTYGVAELLDSTGLVDARREKAAALMSLESLLLTSVLTQGVKYITGRKRPADTNDRFDFNGPGDFDSNNSFWSGHSSQPFAVASVVSEVYAEDEPWVPYVAYTLAGGSALSRVNDDRHWFSDIFLGAAAGYFIGKLVTRFNPFLEEQGVGVQPLMQEGGQGLSFNYAF